MGKKEDQAKLSFSVNNGDLAVVKELLAKDKSLADYVQGNGLSMLHVAAMKNYSEIVVALITAGADINCQNKAKDNLTPDYEPKTLPETHEAFITIMRRKAMPLIFAIEGGNISIVSILINAGAKVGGQEVSAAAFCGNLDILKLIVEKAEGSKYGKNWREYSDPIFGNSALHHATRSGYFTCVEFLLQNGFDVNSVNARGSSAITSAIQGLTQNLNGGRGQLASANLLCKSGFKVDLAVNWVIRTSKASTKKPMLYTALHMAALQSQFEIAAVLLWYKAKVDARGNLLVSDYAHYFSATPFYVASNGGETDVSKLKIMELLYHCGADPNAVVYDDGKWIRWTALKEAEADKHFKVAAFLKDLVSKRPNASVLANAIERVMLRVKVEEETFGASTSRSSQHVDIDAIGRSLAIKSADLTLGAKLGEGGCGAVYKAKWQGIDVAVKQLHEKTLSPEVSDEFFREAKIMLDLRHPNIVPLFGICTESAYSMVMEYMSKGSLYGILRKEKLSSPVIWDIMHDVSLGMLFLHSKGMVHRDLKSLNILLTESGCAKIADFGLAKVKQPKDATTTAGGPVGTLPWMAPELFAGKSGTVKSDIYAFAVVLWEILTGKIPFENVGGVYQLIMLVSQGGREKIPTETPAFYVKLIEGCWAQDQERRPEMKTVVAYLEEHKNELIGRGELQQATTASALSVLPPQQFPPQFMPPPNQLPSSQAPSYFMANGVSPTFFATRGLMLATQDRPSAPPPPQQLPPQFMPPPNQLPPSQSPSYFMANGVSPVLFATRGQMLATQDRPSAPPSPPPY